MLAFIKVDILSQHLLVEIFTKRDIIEVVRHCAGLRMGK